ncbi:MAG: hypothetical protein ACREBG_28520 [Pyrinomonadaceae bacterium]
MTDTAFRDLESQGSVKIRRRRWVHLAAIWGIWTFIGIVFTLQGYFTSYRSERPMPLTESLYLQMTWSYVWALGTPLVLWASARLPIERSNWIKSALLHVPIKHCSERSLDGVGTRSYLANFWLPHRKAPDL